tara:strand:- start:19 stop:1311 length:1293 start_codon:yes stop_codon:yes gene_type:complete
MTFNIYKHNAYYGFEELPKDSLYNIDDLFVISNLGQLKHVTSFIKKKSIKNCFLVVVYTDVNLAVPQAIHDNYEVSIFNSVLFLKLPNNPNSLRLINIKKMESDYKELIYKINPNSLYLNSFQHHYAVLASIAKKSGSKVILIEEGLGTYRLGLDEHDLNSGKLDFSLVKRLSKDTVSKTEIFKRTYKKYKLIKDFTIQSKRLAKKIYLSPEVQYKLIGLYPNSSIDSFSKPFIDFDESYTSFPELTDQKFNVKKNNYYLSFEEPTKDESDHALSIIRKYDIKSKDYLYLSQKFSINRVEYLAIVKGCLLKLLEGNDSTVFIKLHPKQEHELVLAGFIEMEKETGGRIKVIQESRFLIEEVVKVSKVQGVIGITSSALVYSPLLSPGCKSYSIADTLVSNLINHTRNTKGIDMIEAHTKILKQFENIYFI